MNIYTIATMAGVSPSTVSKVINNKGNISEETRQRVLEIIAQNGFQPRICSNAASNIGVVYRESQGDPFSSSFVSSLLSGISNFFMETEHNLLLLGAERLPRKRDQLQVFCHRNHLDGIIFLDLKNKDHYVLELDGIVPMVMLSVDLPESDTRLSLRPNDYQGAKRAMDYLIRMGHRRIACAVLDQEYRSHEQRLQAYVDALKENGIPYEPMYAFDDSKFDERSFRILYDSWKQLDMLPTEIFCSNDDTAILLLSHLRSMGLSVPQDISIVGFDDYPYSSHLTPALTTVHQPIRELGQQAARSIEYYSRHRCFSPEDRTFSVSDELIIRHSVRKLV